MFPKYFYVMLFVMTSFMHSVCVAETFIYIEDKPQIWLYPEDPAYQAWYKHSDLIKLARFMQDNGHESLALFSKSALRQMAILYEDEATKLREEKPTSISKNFNKSQWHSSALEYARRLQVVVNGIDHASQIVLYIEEYGQPTIVIDGKPYLLTTPDLSKSGMLYTMIIEDLCGQGICLQENEQEEIGTHKLKTVVKAEWKMSTTEPPEYVSEAGLHFIFDNLTDRKQKQKVSLQIMRELEFISTSLHEIANKGIAIDWESVRIERISGAYGVKIIINDFGDSMAMSLIYLAQMETLLIQALPWLQARVKGQTIQHRFERADELISEFIH